MGKELDKTTDIEKLLNTTNFALTVQISGINSKDYFNSIKEILTILIQYNIKDIEEIVERLEILHFNSKENAEKVAKIKDEDFEKGLN